MLSPTRRPKDITYYAGLPSKPKLVYRTGKEQWSPPQEKELCPVFDHPITEAWNHDMAQKVVDIMDAHKIGFTTIDLVRFKNIYEALAKDEETVKVIGPSATIWVGVDPGSTSATAAHNAAQDVLALLRDYQITDGVDIEYRESVYRLLSDPPIVLPHFKQK